MKEEMTEETLNPKRPEDFLRLELPESGFGWKQKERPLLISVLIHVAPILLLAMPITRLITGGEEPVLRGEVTVRFYDQGGEGPGGGGGGGGSGGRRITAYIRTRIEPDPEKPPEPRQAPVAPRKLPSLKFDDLEVPDVPTDTDVLFGNVFSPDAVEFPGLSLLDSADYGGLDTERSSGTGGGIGGGKGTGVGTGEGWGVGPGRGGGFGGGDYRPGNPDIDPVLVFKPPEPPYPPRAADKMIAGEVILEIMVKLDGSTEVIRVIKSLRYCTEAAIENARLWRWKPGLTRGEPVEAMGIITVTFDFISSKKGKG
jgi:hypothetical protein